MFGPDQPVCAFAEEVEKAAKRRADKHENAPEIFFFFRKLIFLKSKKTDFVFVC
jgi:hypothetical protein